MKIVSENYVKLGTSEDAEIPLLRTLPPSLDNNRPATSEDKTWRLFNKSYLSSSSFKIQLVKRWRQET